MPTDSSLVSLEDLITGTKPERSLMMTYCGDLAYFERVLLPDLQQEGAAAVTLLIDRNQYEASFAQLTGISGPGVRYQLHPVRLPNPHAAFHPKLYCHCRPGSAVLLVASANLTFYGARTNAEVVDRLVLDDKGQIDVSAFQSYLEFLESLPSLDESIPPAARSAIDAQAALIRTLLPSSLSTTDQGPLFLHNLAVPLLDQITTHVPPKEVRQVTVFSPFFDPGSLAINALAKAYPRAKLTIIKRGEHVDDFNGGALSPISSRLQVKGLSTLDGKKRRLHAKIALFQGPRATWIVSGSANLTAPAWLKATRDGGNVEAVTLRREASSKEAERLLASAATKSIDWRKLVFAVLPDRVSAGEHSSCEVFEAELRGTSLRLRCAASSWTPVLPSLGVTVEDHYGGQVFAARCNKLEGNVAEVATELGNSPIVMRDGPVIVQLEVVHRDGRRETGRVWLSRPDSLGMGAKERELYRAKEAFDRFRPTSGQWELLAEGWVRFVGSMNERWQARISSNVPAAPELATTSQTGSADRITERPIRPEDLAVDESTIVLSSAGGRGTSSGLFRELFANVQRLFLDEDKGVTPVSGAGGHTTVRDASDEELEEDTLDEGGEGQSVPSLEKGAVTSVTQQLDVLWSVVNSSEVVADRVDDVVGVLEHSLGSFLLPLYLQVSATQSAGAVVVIESMRHAWASAVSLHGLAEGHPQGWLVRAWADPRTREAVDAALSVPDRAGRLLALLAAAAIVPADNGALLPWQGEDNVISGLLLLLRSTKRAASAALTESAQKSMEQVAVKSQSLLPIADLLSAVVDRGSENLAIVRAARRWSTVARLTLADDGIRDVSPLEKTLGAEDNGLLTTYRSVRRRYRPAVVPPVLVGESLSCGGCNTQLSTVRAERLRRLDVGLQTCESCGRLLVPFDFQNRITRRVLEALAPGVRFTLDAGE